MAFFENTYKVDITPGATEFPVINVSQYDNLSRTLSFELTYNGEIWQIPTGCEAYILGTKPDGLGFMIPAIILDNKVTVQVRDSMTAIGGLVPCEIRITSGTDIVLGTTNFILKVECAAMDDNTAISDADIAALEELLRQYREFSALAATATTLVAGSDATASYSGGVFSFGIPTGPVGPEGPAGVDGKAATVTVGTTITGEPDTGAQVTNSGTSTEAVLNFVIPRGLDGRQGVDGKPATITAGTTETGDPGTPANVTNSGTSTDAVLNFVIPRGADGRPGVDGKAATIVVGATETTLPGTDANVTNSGTSSNVILNFAIPRGDKGDVGPAGKNGLDGVDGISPTITVGTTSTGEPGTNAQVTNSGTTSAAIFDFVIPRGAKGDTGDTGPDGRAATITVGTVSSGTTASVINSGTTSAAVFDFVLPKGDQGDDGKDGCLCAVEGTVLIITNAQANGTNERY